MTVGQLFQVADAVYSSLKAHGLLDANGNYTKPVDVLLIEDITLVAEDVAKDLEAQGIAIQPKVDKLLKALPAIIELTAATIA